jgi:hypothetical protein
VGTRDTETTIADTAQSLIRLQPTTSALINPPLSGNSSDSKSTSAPRSITVSPLPNLCGPLAVAQALLRAA